MIGIRIVGSLAAVTLALLGGHDVALAQPAPIKIGVVLPLTGNPAVSGTTSQAGMKLYLDSIGNKVAGHPLQVIFVDDQGGAADVGLTKARQLVESDRVDFLMGGVTTAVCYAIAPYATQMRVPMVVSGNCAAQGLTIDPRYASPYVIRLTQNGASVADPAADWAYRNGLRRAVLFTSDFAAGVEISDLFASAFIARGGEIVQEIHPPRGTNDFGPFFAQLDPKADFLAVMLAGGELGFVDQFANYVRDHKLKVIDLYGQATNGEYLPQHAGKALGMLAVSPYAPGLNTKENKAFLAAWNERFPNRAPTMEAAVGYSAAQAVVAALDKVKGDLEGDAKRKSFLEALYQTSVTTPRGPITLDPNRDIVQNIYVYEVVPGATGGVSTTKVISTYPEVSQHWDRSPAQLRSFKYGRLKGTWVGKTKEQLGDVLTLPKGN